MNPSFVMRGMRKETHIQLFIKVFWGSHQMLHMYSGTERIWRQRSMQGLCCPCSFYSDGKDEGKHETKKGCAEWCSWRCGGVILTPCHKNFKQRICTHQIKVRLKAVKCRGAWQVQEAKSIVAVTAIQWEALDVRWGRQRLGTFHKMHTEGC